MTRTVVLLILTVALALAQLPNTVALTGTGSGQVGTIPVWTGPNSLGNTPLNASNVVTGSGQAGQQAIWTGSNSVGGAPAGTVIGGNSSTINGTNCYLGLFSGECSANQADVQVPVPRGGTISKFYFQSATGGTNGVPVVLLINGTNTAITCVTAGVNQSCNDLTDTATVAIGQAITVFVNGNVKVDVAWSALLN